MHGILSQGVFLFMAVDREAALIRKFMEFAKLMNVYVNHFPKHERYALSNRIRNSAYQVYDLVVEGQKRYHKKTTLTSLDVAHDECWSIHPVTRPTDSAREVKAKAPCRCRPSR